MNNIETYSHVENYARIVRESIMTPESTPELRLYEARLPDGSGFVTSGVIIANGVMQSTGWSVSASVSFDGDSLKISVKPLEGRAEYSTDILARFLSDTVVHEYAEHALAYILKKNAI